MIPFHSQAIVPYGIDPLWLLKSMNILILSSLSGFKVFGLGESELPKNFHHLH